MKFQFLTLLLACVLIPGCRETKSIEDRLVVTAAQKMLFEAPLENNAYLKEYYHVVSIEKTSEQESDLTQESRGVLKAIGQTVHTKITLELKKDCNSKVYHPRFPIPSCDLGSGPESSVERTPIPQHKKGQQFVLENVDLKFIKQKESADSPWTVF